LRGSLDSFPPPGSPTAGFPATTISGRGTFVTAVTILGIVGLCVIVTVPLAKLLITGLQKTRH
jgi:hypothetical protein